jgi:antitoxin (DNA-binding transcriptional repressor) of toxin-antitoxin stability system
VVDDRGEESTMQTIPLEQAQSHLAEIIEKLPLCQEIIITRGDKPVAKLISTPGEQPHPMPGRGRGMLTIISEDEDQLKDFAEYMP